MEQENSKPILKTKEFIRTRLKLFEFAISHSLEELIRKTIDEVGALTESSIGFFHFMESDGKTLSLQAWSTRTVNEFCKAEGKGTHYEIDKAGVWVDCVHQKRPVIHNDYASLPHRKGLPPGHAAVIRELVVPVMRDDRIVAILGVGNKPSDYTEEDVEMVSFLADVAWEIVEHKKTDEALYKEHKFSKNILDTAQTIIVVLDTDGYIISINPFMEELSGYRLDEVKGKEWFSTFLPERDRENIRAVFKKAVGDIRTKGNVSSMVLKDGSVRDVEWYDCTLKDKDGKIIGLLATGQDVTERELAEEKLRTSQQQLRALAERLEKIREEERILLSREIHDFMGGGLTGLKMDLSWLMHKLENAESDKEKSALMDRITSSSESIDKMIRVIRRISTELRPPLLDDLGLIAALEWHLSEFTRRTGIVHELDTAFEFVYMEEDTAVAVFRIFQETLTNVIRHSGATKVTVVLREKERSLSEEQMLVLEIRDNGRGITKEEILNSESLGLLGIKERVMAFGGELSICGEPGKGTSVILKIPGKQGEDSHD